MAEVVKVEVGSSGIKGVARAVNEVAGAAKKRAKKAEKGLATGKISLDI